MKNPSQISELNVPGNGASATQSMIATKSNSVGEFHNILADVEQLIKDATSLNSDDFAQAKAAIGARLALAKESVVHMGGNIADKTRQAAKATDSYVHEHPWQSVGAGAALGLLVGFLVARR